MSKQTKEKKCYAFQIEVWSLDTREGILEKRGSDTRKGVSAVKSRLVKKYNQLQKLVNVKVWNLESEL